MMMMMCATSRDPYFLWRTACKFSSRLLGAGSRDLAGPNGNPQRRGRAAGQGDAVKVKWLPLLVGLAVGYVVLSPVYEFATAVTIYDVAITKTCWQVFGFNPFTRHSCRTSDAIPWLALDAACTYSKTIQRDPEHNLADRFSVISRSG
jgi:hypothetical protein